MAVCRYSTLVDKLNSFVGNEPFSGNLKTIHENRTYHTWLLKGPLGYYEKRYLAYQQASNPFVYQAHSPPPP